jgi:hypothetical protein
MAAGKPYAGKNLRIRVDGKTIFHATECTFDTTRNMDSIASKDTEGEESLPGSYTWNVSTNYLVADKPGASTTQLGIKEVLDMYQEGAEVEVQFTTNIVGDVVISGQSFIESINMTAGTNGVATGSAGFKGRGNFTTELVAA